MGEIFMDTSEKANRISMSQLLTHPFHCCGRGGFDGAIQFVLLLLINI
jgi:hypothetical protein